MIPARDRVSGINAMPRDTPESVFVYHLDTCTPRQFDKLAIAEALGGAPPALTPVLLRAQHRQDLLASLRGAEARLQISLMHRVYESGPADDRAVSVRANLTRIRKRLNWLWAHQATDDSRRRDAAQGWAFSQLRKAHQAEYDQLYARMQEEHGTTPSLPPLPPGVRADMAVWIALIGFPCPELTVHQRWLWQGRDKPFRERVVQEIRDPELDTVFDHPLLVRRWMEHLDELADAVCEALDILLDHDRFVSDVDLVLDGDLSPEQARTRISRFHFLAALYGRKVQARRVIQHWEDTIDVWKKSRDQAKAFARTALVAAHAAQFDELVAGYGQASFASGRLAQTHAVKAMPHKAEQFLKRAVKLGWNVDIYSPDGVAHGKFPNSLVLVAYRVRDDRFPAMACGFRRNEKSRSWKDHAKSVLAPSGSGRPTWVPFTSVADLLHLLDLPDREIAEVVRARQNARRSSSRSNS